MLLLLMAATSTAKAQWRYGLLLGGDFANASLSRAEGYKMVNRSGFRGGVTFEYQMPTNGLAFDGSLLYTRYNARLSYEGGKAFSYGRDFLEAAVNIKHKFFLSSTRKLVAPLIYTGPSLMIGLDRKDGPLRQYRLLPCWNVGAGIDIVNFIQITAAYSFGLGNSVDRFTGAEDARLYTDGIHVSAVILFDF